MKRIQGQSLKSLFLNSSTHLKIKLIAFKRNVITYYFIIERVNFYREDFPNEGFSPLPWKTGRLLSDISIHQASASEVSLWASKSSVHYRVKKVKR